jgi:hypothetical protein
MAARCICEKFHKLMVGKLKSRAGMHGFLEEAKRGNLAATATKHDAKSSHEQ